MTPRSFRRPRLTCAAGVLVLMAVLAAVLSVRATEDPSHLGQTVGAVPTTTEAPELDPPPAPQPVVVTAPAPPVTAAPAPGPAPPPANLVRLSSQAAFLARVQGEALRQVTAYGLASYGMLGGRFGSPAVMEPVAAPLPSMAPSMGAPGAGAPPVRSEGASAPTAAQTTSGTNVQEAGVDEPDLAKTDGRVLVAISGQGLAVVDVAGAPRLAATLTLPAGARPMSLLLAGTRVIVLSAVDHAGPATLPHTDVVVVELGDPARPKVVRSHRLAGWLVAARLVDGRARLVLAHAPQIGWAQPVDGTPRAQEVALASNRQRVRSSTFEQWVAPGTGCSDAYTSPVESGLATVAVRTIDPAAAAPGAGVCVTSQATTVYASTGSLYVGTTTFDTARAVSEGRTGGGGEATTSLHRFDITDPVARYTGSGVVAGTLLNQFSLSEHGSDLRVATTRHGGAVASESQVAVLRPNGQVLDQIGLLGGLGRTERIFAVRFVGSIGYVVTFSRMMCDPLFVVDLADPARPRLRGTLEVQGFSSYLHPTSPSRVLSIGRDSQGARGPAGPCETTSPQVSLYDVAQPDSPRQLQRLVLPPGASEAGADHHAFTYWAPLRLLIIPVSFNDPAFRGALGLRVEDGGIVEVGRISHPPSASGSSAIRRSYVVGGRLLTVSGSGVASNDLASLAPQGFTSFGPAR